MSKIYEVVHIYDVDGEFGDAITRERVVGRTSNKEIAEEYVRRYSRPEVYGHPYDWLWCHRLTIREINDLEDLDVNVDPWENDRFSAYIKRVRERYGDEVPAWDEDED